MKARKDGVTRKDIESMTPNEYLAYRESMTLEEYLNFKQAMKSNQ